MKRAEKEIFQSTILSQPSRLLSFAEALAGCPHIIDVRSQNEYLEGSLPGAVNLPVFDNDERHLVGSIYRHGGKQQAVDKGFDLVSSRLDRFLAGFEGYRGKEIGVFCARGGMRSRSVVNLLLQHGYSAWQLAGGYKAYRKNILEYLESCRPQLIVLHGHTGTGKTRLLHKLRGVIDLEDIAQHQSSLFGGLNRQPRSQKSFDTILHIILTSLSGEPYFIEGESRKMGNIYLPVGLARAMKDGYLVLVTASLETRVKRIVEDYPLPDEESVQKVGRIIESLRARLGGSITDKLHSLLASGDVHELVRILLLEYYDKRYDNSLKKHTYHHLVSSEDISGATAELTSFRRDLLRSKGG